MPAILSEKQQQLILGKNFAQLATLSEDGAPQLTPVWIDFDGTHVVFNTALGRAKKRNLERDPRVAVNIMDAQNPYHHVEVRGRVVSMTTEGADAHIDKLSHKYLGKDYPFRRPGEDRIIVKIEPLKVFAMGE